MTESIQYQSLVAVANVVKGLTLDGLDSSRVIMEPVGDEKGKSMPFISVFPGEPETFPVGDDDGGNSADRVDYKVMVAIVAGRDEWQTMLPKVLKWREQIRQAFLRKRLSAVSVVQRMEVEPQAVVDRAAWFTSGLLVSGLKVIVISQENRT